jgi:uncharacterized protein YdeI (YjbR/CyaY-like superfamily)
MARDVPLLEVTTRGEWRAWLARHHDREREIWLVFWKKHSGKPSLPYVEAVEEAICFGWIDSLVRRLDDERYAQKFTPRQAKGCWTELNRRRFARLVEEGRMTAVGLAKGPQPNTPYERPRPPRRDPEAPVPGDFEAALRAQGGAWENFSRLAPSHRRHYLGWIETAKRPETRARRVAESVARLARNEKLGLK